MRFVSVFVLLAFIAPPCLSATLSEQVAEQTRLVEFRPGKDAFAASFMTGGGPVDKGAIMQPFKIVPLQPAAIDLPDPTAALAAKLPGLPASATSETLVRWTVAQPSAIQSTPQLPQATRSEVYKLSAPPSIFSLLFACLLPVPYLITAGRRTAARSAKADRIPV